MSSASVQPVGKPRFSIVIPAYNAERYLARCLRSVVRQSHSPHEVLIYDDGSQDRTASIAGDFAARHPNLCLIQQTNTGQGVIRNRGIDRASGDYVLFVDSDDELDVDTLRACAAAISQSAPDFATFRYRARYPLGSLESVWTADIATRRELVGGDTERLFANRWLAPWQSAYRVDFLREKGLRNGEGYLFEDQEFTAGAILAADRVVLIDRPLYQYHFNAASSLRDESDAARRRRIDGRRRSRTAVLAAIARHGSSDLGRALLADHDFYDFVTEVVLGIYTAAERDEVLEDVARFLQGLQPVRSALLTPALAEWFARPFSGRDSAALADALGTLVAAERERVSGTVAFRLARRLTPTREAPSVDPLVDERYARVVLSAPHRILRRLGNAAGPGVRAVRRMTGSHS